MIYILYSYKNNNKSSAHTFDGFPSIRTYAVITNAIKNPFVVYVTTFNYESNQFSQLIRKIYRSVPIPFLV